jgi:hypothetical protein
MSLLQYREKIHTDCSQLDYLRLNIGGIKIDASSSCSLKNTVKCSAMASCDYIKKRKSKIYFIEISDLKYEIKNYMHSGDNKRDAYRKCKTGLRTKFSETKHIFDEILKHFKINSEYTKHAIIAICQGTQSDIIALSLITNALKQHHVPILYTDMRLIIYNDLVKL